MVRPPLPLLPQLPPRGLATVLRITRAETRTDATQALSAPVNKRSAAVLLLMHVRRQYYRENKYAYHKIIAPQDRSALDADLRRSRPARALYLARRSDSATIVLPRSSRAASPTSGAPVSNAAPLNLSTRAGTINVALPNHAVSTTSVAPPSRVFQRGCPPSVPPDLSVTRLV